MKEIPCGVWLSASATGLRGSEPGGNLPGPERRKLLDFTTESDSGKLPGAAPMLGVGAAAQGGVTAGMAVANAAVSGVKTYKSDVARMAAASGDQAVRYLSEFFARQGWIRADQVRKARIVN
jgi:hypothetical protein